MLKSITTLILSFLVAGLAGAHAHGHDGDILIENAWARTSAPGAPSAGFMLIVNNSQQDDVLLGVTSRFAKKSEVHQTKQVDGVMKMIHQQQGVVIPAGEQVMFKPGGYHLMFMGLQKNFELGESYQVTLTFEKAGEMQLELPVKDMADMPKANH